MKGDRPRIVLGVTSPMSLALLKGIPQRLANEGWQVNLVSAPGAALDAIQEGEIQVQAIPMSRDPHVLRDLISLWRWWRYLGTVKPDVLLVGTPKAGMLGILAGLCRRVPVRLYHLRGLRMETATGLGRLIFRAVETLTLMGATGSVAVSESLRERALHLRLGRANKIVVLGRGSSNGVDVARFRPFELTAQGEISRAGVGLLDSVPVIGFVGRVHPDKGLDTLAAASALLSARGVAHQLLVVGGVDHPLAETLLSELRSLEARVVLTGPVSDTAPYYRMMDLHCLPTLREGFPNAILEAAASGVASVTTTATGAIDAVIDRETGYIVPVQDHKALAEAVERALSDRVELSRLASNARQWVITHYSRDRVQDALVDHLRRAVRTTHVR